MLPRKQEILIKKKNTKLRSDCRQCIVQLQRYMMCCEVSTNMKRSNRWALVGRIRQILTVLANLPVKKKIQFWMLGGIEEAHACAVQFLKIIITSSRRLHHVSNVASFISNDLAILCKFLGNSNEDLLHAVLSAGTLVSEGHGLLYKSQTKAYSVIIKCVLQEYFCVDGGASSKWLCWCGVLLSHLWLICTESGNPRMQVLSFSLPRLPQKLKDVNGDYQQTCTLIMKTMDAIVQLAPIYLRPFPNALWQKFDHENLIEVADYSGIPYRIFQKLHRCVKDVRSILRSKSRKMQRFKSEITNDIKNELRNQPIFSERKMQRVKSEITDDMKKELTNQTNFSERKMINENEEAKMKIFLGPSKLDSTKEIKLYIEYSSCEI